MKVDTGQRTIRLQVQKQLFAVLTGLLFAISYLPAPRDLLDEYLYSHYLVSILFIVFYIFYQLYFWLRDISYIFAADDLLQGMLCIRFFRILPFVSVKRTIELPQEELFRYEVQTTWHGLRHYVRIWQQRGQDLYVFPRFSITILRKKEKQELFALLDQYVATK